MNTEKSTYTILSPFNGKPVGTAPNMTDSDARAAIASAQAATESWADTDWQTRTGLICVLSELVAREAADFAELISRENGILRQDAEMLVQVVIAELSYWSELDESILFETYEAENPPSSSRKRHGVGFRAPHGVVGCIAPFNANILGSVSKFIPAVLAGNTVVLKPAHQNPLATVKLYELVKLAGFPSGVVNLVVGQNPKLGQIITQAPEVRMISFTGSTTVGLEIQKVASQTLKRTSLELGGKGSLIVTPDADIEAACEALSGVWTRQAGQICSIPSRALVHEEVYDTVLQNLMDILSNLRYAIDEHQTGKGWVVPVISAQQVNRVVEITNEMDPSHGTIHQLNDALPESGSFTTPTLIEVHDRQARPFQEELFGPVLCITAYSDIDHAISLANGTDYGLVDYIFTKEPESADMIKLFRSLASGNVVINGTRPHSKAPIGGTKLSGIGREGHPHSLYNFTEMRALTWY